MEQHQDLHLQLDFEIPSALIDVYSVSTESEFLGYDTPLNREQAKKKLEEYASTKMYGGSERLAIMKIWKGDVLVGYSFPRKVKESERNGFKIPMDEVQWYRLGTIFVLPEYRGSRITTKVVEKFHSMYENLVWQCEEENTASFKSASLAGFNYSHHIYFEGENEWSFEKSEIFHWGYRVLKLVRHV